MSKSKKAGNSYLPNLIRFKKAEHSWLKDAARDIKANLKTAPVNAPADFWELMDKAGYEPAYHFTPFVDMMLKAVDEQVRTTFAAPPRHGKTIVTLCLLAWHSWFCKKKSFAYITFSQKRAERVQKQFLAILERLGVEHAKKDEWVEVRGGVLDTRDEGVSVRFTSVGGGITGFDVDIAVCDDLIKDSQEAGSPTRLEQIWDWMQESLFTRNTGNLSIVVMMTRWAVNDTIGQLIADRDWPYCRIPAICDDEENDPSGRKLGEPLWSKRPLEMLHQAKFDVGPQSFSSMYQGLPVAEGEFPFDRPATYASLPAGPFKNVAGLDLAYKAGKGDYSVLVTAVHDIESGYTYITDVVRKQLMFDDFIPLVLERVDETYEMTWFYQGTDMGFKEQLQKMIRFNAIPAAKAKMVRATEVKKAWNAGKVLLPVNPTPVMLAFLAEVTSFTGLDSDKHDDCVDALAGMYHPIANPVRPASYDSLWKTGSGKRLMQKMARRRMV